MDHDQLELPHDPNPGEYVPAKPGRVVVIDTLKTYYYLTKPGIIYGNAVTVVAGFFFAAKGHVDWGLLLAILAGTSLVIGSACVVNNLTDRNIDHKMARTQGRALVTGRVSIRPAVMYAAVLGVVGFAVLLRFVNYLTAVIGLIAFVDYVLLYGLSKRRSVHSTLIGSICGAAPIVAGYTAVTGRFDGAAAILFAMMVIWQMPHFYAIGIYRLQDYAAAGLPILPVSRGLAATRAQMLGYIGLFIAACALLRIFGYAGWWYFGVTLALGLAWLGQALRDWRPGNEQGWARHVFGFSLVVLLGMAAMVSVGSVLP